MRQLRTINGAPGERRSFCGSSCCGAGRTRLKSYMSMEDAIAHATAALAQKGFGVLTTINVRATLKKKLDVDFRPYTIIGACNPTFAHKALQSEDKTGTMLPCNVIVHEIGEGRRGGSGGRPRRLYAGGGRSTNSASSVRSGGSPDALNRPHCLPIRPGHAPETSRFQYV